MSKYLISFVLNDQNKYETITFDSATERQLFFNSLRKDAPIKDVMFSEYNGEVDIKQEGSDGMLILIQSMLFFLTFAHLFMGNDIFPLLCLLAFNEIVNRLLTRKGK